MRIKIDIFVCRFYRQFILFAFYFSISMVCFVLRPGPPPTGLKPPLINYTSTSTTVATTPFDFMDNESMLPDMYDEMMIGGGGLTELDAVQATTEMATGSDNATTINNGSGIGTPLIYEDGRGGRGGGTVSLHGKSSGSDRGKHRSTWNPANHTFKTNYTYNYNKVGGTRDTIILYIIIIHIAISHEHVAWRVGMYGGVIYAGR